MKKEFSSTAMVLAAGLGTRMKPLTLTKPKPLQRVGGRTMLDHALDKLVGAGIERVVVNVHYLAEQIENHLKSRTDIEIVLSHEDELLDTGGGIAHALPHFEDKPFFALNADLPWMDGPTASLERMQACWQSERMDALLLLMQTQKSRGFDRTKGDFALSADGQVWRQNVPTPRPFVWISAQILKPHLFANPPAKVFSNNLIWSRVEETKRLYGIEHDGTCYHVGTPEDLDKANKLLTTKTGWAV